MLTVEEQFYETAGSEIAERRVVPAIWAKAFSDALGDVERTGALHTKYRLNN